MHRFFLEKEDQHLSEFIIIKNCESLNHLIRVLRVKIGEQLEIVAPNALYITEPLEINSNQITLKILKQESHSHESNVQIDLFQCMPKGQKLELILQKNVELGVHSFYLLDSKRCIVEYKEKEIPKKMERFEKIIKEASKQSKRDHIPELYGIYSFKDIAKMIPNYDAFIVLFENEHSRSLKSLITHFDGKKIAVLIGPEGGLENQEIFLSFP